jgi:malate synthase
MKVAKKKYKWIGNANICMLMQNLRCNKNLCRKIKEVKSTHEKIGAQTTCSFASYLL